MFYKNIYIVSSLNNTTQKEFQTLSGLINKQTNQQKWES